MPLVQLSNGKSFEVPQGVTLLEAAIKAGIAMPHSCKTGRCCSCRCMVISGESKVLSSECGLSELDRSRGWILSCARTILTDLVLEVDDLGGAVLPPIKVQACRIVSLNRVAPDVVRVVLRLPPSATFPFIPGQYIDVIGPGGTRRSYSLANSPIVANTLELHIRAVKGGAMSNYWFNQARVNDLLHLRGPHGTFFLRNIAQRDLVFLATGTGIAPIKAMLEALPRFSLDETPKSVSVLWGARNVQDLYFDIKALPGSHEFIPVLSRPEGSGWFGEQGHVQDVLLRRKSDLLNCSVYACGSDSMIYSARIALTSAGLPRNQFYSDAFVCSSNLESQ